MYQLREGTHFNPDVVTRSGPLAFTSAINRDSGSIVFVCAFSDFFIEEADAWRSDVWDIFRGSPDVNFIIPTKRPERIAQSLPSFWPLKNVFLGVSCEDQKTYDTRSKFLAQTQEAPGYVFLFEPVLGHISIGTLPEKSWVIIGGETGENRRDVPFDYFHEIMEDCRVQNVPFYFHQIDGIRVIPDLCHLRQYPSFLV
jgi:protein gp37